MHPPLPPSEWVKRFLPLLPDDGEILDLACGRGRHTQLLVERGRRVVALDRDLSGLGDLAKCALVEPIAADLEDGAPFPLAGRQFAAVIVTNYLYRPIFGALLAAIAPGGLLIYETFARGNEGFGRPRNPDHLLEPGELLDRVHRKLRVLAYEDLILTEPRPAAVQRICARRKKSEIGD